MSVRSVEYVVVDCDVCGLEHGDAWDEWDEDDAIENAGEHGWSSPADGFHICKACAADPAKQAKVAVKFKEATGEDLPVPSPLEQAILMHEKRLAVSA